MGTYDVVKLEYPIKVLGRDWTDHLFQTKSLKNTLGDYRVTKDGKLIETKYKLITRHKKKSKTRKNKFYSKFHNKYQVKKLGEVDMLYHGDLEIHDFFDDEGYISLTLRFTEGRLVRWWVNKNITTYKKLKKYKEKEDYING